MRRVARRNGAGLALAALAALCVAAAGAGAGPPTSAPAAALRRSVAVLPHDTYPGFSVKKFDGAGYRLLETGFSQFFTVLEDGLVMTTSDLSPLVNRPVNLVVLEETPNATATHTLQLYVLDRRHMLRFRQDVYEGGAVAENAPAGTRVQDVPVLRAAGGAAGDLPVHYTITAGNDDGAFKLVDDTDAPANDTGAHGVRLVTARPLDREARAEYTLTVQAADGRGIDRAVAKVHVSVLDENDNSPVFSKKVYRFSLGGEFRDRSNASGSAWRRFARIGGVTARDADGDKVAYRLAAPSNLVVIVPQTGDLLLAGDPPLEPGEDMEYEIAVDAHDLRHPSRTAKAPAQVYLRFSLPAEEDGEGDEGADEAGNEVDAAEAHGRREKRRVTRAVRPTKRIEFTEADGENEGRVVFQLEKETERETFKIREENPWVTVEPNGAVRVKKKWDYEELGPEKTIDFWVTITNAGGGAGPDAGKCAGRETLTVGRVGERD
ncbi:hypothetical protein R5R35_007768 [Gryllus longicercus]|uniref:Cadherin domain-containing protein n=1 Tax=Gryllus longicercus TaxID=2509291 RepID=A0AAN9W9E4_9ORTH